MANPFEDENSEFLVLVNDEGQYSLWPVFREAPQGWLAVGPRGKRTECLAWVEQKWTDMRPTSLRRAMDNPSSNDVRKVAPSLDLDAEQAFGSTDLVDLDVSSKAQAAN